MDIFEQIGNIDDIEKFQVKKDTTRDGEIVEGFYGKQQMEMVFKDKKTYIWSEVFDCLGLKSLKLSCKDGLTFYMRTLINSFWRIKKPLKNRQIRFFISLKFSCKFFIFLIFYYCVNNLWTNFSQKSKLNDIPYKK